MTEFILPAILNLFEPLNILLMIAGLAGGIIIGALPGLSATMGVALMVPATFAMNPTSGLIMLGAIYAGAIYGGANSAILICTPGTPSSVATTFDGWPARRVTRILGCTRRFCPRPSGASWGRCSCCVLPDLWHDSHSNSADRKVFGCVSSGSPPSR